VRWTEEMQEVMPVGRVSVSAATLATHLHHQLQHEFGVVGHSRRSAFAQAPLQRSRPVCSAAQQTRWGRQQQQQNYTYEGLASELHNATRPSAAVAPPSSVALSSSLRPPSPPGSLSQEPLMGVGDEGLFACSTIAWEDFPHDDADL